MRVAPGSAASAARSGDPLTAPWWPRCPRGSCLAPGLLGRRRISGRKIFLADGSARLRQRDVDRWRRSGFSRLHGARRVRLWQFGFGCVVERALDLFLGVGKRIEVAETTDRAAEVADRTFQVFSLLFQFDQFRFAHGLLELTLKFGGHASDLAHVLAKRPQNGRQLFRPDRDQRDDADDDELAPTNVEHELVNSETPTHGRRCDSRAGDLLAHRRNDQERTLSARRSASVLDVLPPASIVLNGSLLASAVFSSSDMPFLKALMPWAKSPMSDEIFPRPPNKTITTSSTMIQCHILREPIGKSSAAASFWLIPPCFQRETRPRGGQKQGLRAPVKAPRNPLKWRRLPYLALVYFSERDAGGARLRSRSPGSSGSSSSRNVESSDGSGTPKPGGKLPSRRPAPLSSSRPGRSPTSSSPKCERNASVVPYVIGRPGALRRPRGRIHPVLRRTSSVPAAATTPRISSISARVTGRL